MADIGDTASDISEAVENINKLGEREHEEIRGGANWVFGEHGLEPSYEKEMQTLDDAQRDYESQDVNTKDNQQIVAQKQQEADWRFGARTAVLRESQIQFPNIYRQHDERIHEASVVAGDPKREAEIKVARLNLAGDSEGVQKEQFEQHQANQRMTLVDRHGDQSAQVKLFEEKSGLERQELAGKRATERQQLESESARAIADIQREAQEAQLRAAGNGYAADRETAALDIGPQRAGDTETTNQHAAEDDGQREPELVAEQSGTGQGNAISSDLGNVAGYGALSEGPLEQQAQESGGSGTLASDRVGAAARIGEFLAQRQNSGTGRIMSAQQYGDSLQTAALHGDGAAQDLGLAGADLKTLGVGNALTGNLGEVGQKLSTAADKWNHIADQMRNVTILTMGR
jgi:hypothetical protein